MYLHPWNRGGTKPEKNGIKVEHKTPFLDKNEKPRVKILYSISNSNIFRFTTFVCAIGVNSA